MKRRRPILLSAFLISGIAAAGLILRLMPLGLPSAFVKYGGSVLWALMVYSIVSTACPRWSPLRSAIAAGILASATELSQLHHAPALDAFRLTRPGALLLGRVFSTWDLVAYGCAIALAAMADQAVRRHLG